MGRHTDKTKPADHPELCVIVDVVVQDSGSQGTQLTHGCAETVRSRSDRDGEDFGGDQECSAVGTELLEEAGQKVDGLEPVDVGRFSQVVVSTSGDQLYGRRRGQHTVVPTWEGEKYVRRAGS